MFLFLVLYLWGGATQIYGVTITIIQHARRNCHHGCKDRAAPCHFPLLPHSRKQRAASESHAPVQRLMQTCHSSLSSLSLSLCVQVVPHQPPLGAARPALRTVRPAGALGRLHRAEGVEEEKQQKGKGGKKAHYLSNTISHTMLSVRKDDCVDHSSGKVNTVPTRVPPIMLP